MQTTLELFECCPALPEGFIYRPEFISEAEESPLLDEIRGWEFSGVKTHGVTAKRRVAHFGWTYGYSTPWLKQGAPMPEFLLPLRERAAELI